MNEQASNNPTSNVEAARSDVPIAPKMPEVKLRPQAESIPQPPEPQEIPVADPNQDPNKEHIQTPYTPMEQAEQIHATTGGVWDSMSKMASLDSPLGMRADYEGAWSRFVVQTQMQDDLIKQNAPKMDPADLNKKFPGMPVPFSEPEWPAIAQLQYDDNSRRRQEELWQASGPEMSTTKRFALGMSAGFTTLADPVNLAMNSLVAPAILKAMKVAPGFLANAGTMAGAQLAADIPTTAVNKSEHQDASYAGTVAQAAAGALLMGGIHSLGALALERWKNVPAADKENVLKAVMRQGAEGKPADVSEAEAIIKNRENGQQTPGTFSNFVHQEISHPSQLEFHTATHPENGERMDLNTAAPKGFLVGDAMEPKANNAASDPAGLYSGEVTPMSVHPDASVLRLDAPVSEHLPLLEKMIQSVPELEPHVQDILAEAKKNNLQVSDIIEPIKQMEAGKALPEGTTAKMMTALKESGIDVIHGVAGEGEGKSNHVIVLNEGKVSMGEPVKADPSRVPKIDLDTLNRMVDNKAPSDGSFNQEVERLKNMKPETPAEAKSSTAEDMQRVEKNLSERSKTDPEFAKKLENVDKEVLKEFPKDHEKVAQDLADCMLGGAL